MDKKILNRIQRLQAMANDSSSEHEAMIAARRLHSLLATHGISELDLEDSADNAMSSDEYMVDRKVGGGLWSKHIGSSIADLYFCKAITQGAGGTAHKVFIVGQKQYRDTAVVVARAVTLAINTEARLSSKKDRPKSVDGWAYISSFRTAAARRVALRCREMIDMGRRGELPDEEGEGTLPVLASMYDSLWSEADSYIRDTWSVKTQSVKSRSSSYEGSQKGDEFGKRVPLGKELGGHAPKLIK